MNSASQSNKKDGEAAKISSALKGNSKLGTLDISVEGISVKGAQALAQGIRDSKLTAIAFSGEAENHSEVMRVLYQEGVKQSKTIQGLNMIGSLGDVDAFVDVLPSLRRLKLWSSALDKETTLKLGAGLAGNKSIQELSIFFDNQAHDLVAHLVLSLATRSERLTKLHLRGERENYSANTPNVTSGTHAVSLCIALNAIIDADKTPTQLEILNCESPEDQWGRFCKALEDQTCKLTALTIINSTLTFRKARSLGESLKHNTSLQTLRLLRNHLGDAGLSELSRGLAHNSTLTTLQLANNLVGDAGIYDLINSCKSQSAIQTLELMHNRIGPEGAKAIVISAKDLFTLETLNLSNNENIGVHGLKLIGACLTEPSSLKSLNLSMPTSWEASVPRKATTVANLSKENVGRALVEGLAGNYSIVDLSVSGVDMSPKYRSQIQLYLNLNKCGRRLLVEDEYLSPTLWCYILAKCNGNHSMIHYLLQQKPDSFISRSI